MSSFSIPPQPWPCPFSVPGSHIIWSWHISLAFPCQVSQPFLAFETLTVLRWAGSIPCIISFNSGLSDASLPRPVFCFIGKWPHSFISWLPGYFCSTTWSEYCVAPKSGNANYMALLQKQGADPWHKLLCQGSLIQDTLHRSSHRKPALANFIITQHQGSLIN